MWFHPLPTPIFVKLPVCYVSCILEAISIYSVNQFPYPNYMILNPSAMKNVVEVCCIYIHMCKYGYMYHSVICYFLAMNST